MSIMGQDVMWLGSASTRTSTSTQAEMTNTEAVHKK